MDAKIILNRSTDIIKDVSSLQRREEIMHSYLVKNTNENVEIQKQKIQDLQKKDDNRVLKEKQQTDERETRKKRKPDKKAPLNDEPEVASVETKIDIRI